MFWRLFAIAGGLAFLGLAYWTISPAFWGDGSKSGGTAPGLGVSPVGTAGPTDPVLVGAGDIASCAQDDDEKTAALLDQIVATTVESGAEAVVFTAGDNAYESGTLAEYEQCYGPTWGRHKERTKPVLGNHEYELGTADGSFQYFGAALGDPTEGYYSFDVGRWHVVVLNTGDHCDIVECAAGSAQEQWLREDLAASDAFCTMAIWHEPLFTSGPSGGTTRFLVPFWRALYEFGADVVVNGHEHNYERFAPQTPDGLLDEAQGLRQFVVGSGGNGHRSFDVPRAVYSEVGSDDTYGVIRFTLHPGGYDWAFVPVEGAAFQDSGSAECHGPPAVEAIIEP